MTVIIRQANKTNLSSILSLYAQPSIDDDQVLPLADAQKIFDRICCYPDYKLYVAFCDNKVVGTFALLIMDNLAHLGKPSGILEHVAVDPDYQNQGIGKKMMQHAMALCREAGCYKLTLSSNLVRTGAHRFYESLGFSQHGHSYLIELETRLEAYVPN